MEEEDSISSKELFKDMSGFINPELINSNKGGIIMKIQLQELLSRSLNSVFAVKQLFDEISNSSDEEIILDFSGVMFITASFAQAYVAHKQQSSKFIKEINLNEENEIMLNVIAQKHQDS